MKKSKEKGITLIALIITIIVLLILATVSVATLTGENGIITKAMEARNKTIIAEEDEKVTLAVIASRDTNGNFSIELLKKELKNQGLTYEENEEAIVVTTTNKIYRINEKGEIGAISTEVKVGDYVAYNTTNNYSYTSPKGSGTSHGNGYQNQKFTSNSNMKWRILRNDTKTGEIVLISELPIATDEGEAFGLNGVVGYLYAEQELNEICAIYGHGKGANINKKFTYETGFIGEELTLGTIKGSGARSINVDDINSVTGYNPEEYEGYGDIYTCTVYYPSIKTESGKSTEVKSITYNNTHYTYEAKKYLTDTKSSLYEMLCFTENSSTYLLSHRTVVANSDGSQIQGYVIRQREGIIGIKDVYDSRYICCSSKDVWTGQYSAKVRPIVYLKTDCKLTEKDSNGAWIIKE